MDGCSLSTRKSLAWSFSQQFWQYVLLFIGSVIIARLLTPEEMGVFALAMAANLLVSSFRDFGIGSYLIREEQLTYDKIRTAFGMSIAISWSLGLVVLFARHSVATLYDTPAIADVLLLVSVSFFVTPIGQPAAALLQREMRFDILHHIALASSVVGMATSILLAYFGLSYMSLAWGMVTGTVLSCGLFIVVRPDHLKLWPSLRHWREVLSFGGWLTAASFIGTINTEAIKFVLGGLINPAAVALFERAVQIPIMFRKGLLTPVGRVLFPLFSKDIREGISIGPAVEKLMSATTVVIWPAFLTLGFISEPIVVFLFGENWRVAGEILPYILLSHAILSLLPQPEHVLVPHGKVRSLFWLNAFSTVNSLFFAAIGAYFGLVIFAMLRPVTALLFMIANYFCIAE